MIGAGMSNFCTRIVETAAKYGQRPAIQVLRGTEVETTTYDELVIGIALVLAVLAVADDDHATGADLLDRLLDRRERGLPRARALLLSLGLSHRAHACSFRANGDINRSTYLAITSHSTFNRSPGAKSPRFGPLQGLRDQGNLSPRIPQIGDGQADAAEGDRAFIHHEQKKLGGEA